MDSEPDAEFETFYERTKTPVFRAVLLARAGDIAAAEDAVAEAYEKAYRRWERLAAHPNPTAWVIRTAINHRISAWRRIKREPTSAPPRHVDAVEPLDPHLVRLLRDLPKGQREVLALRVLLDFSVEQTAKTLGVKQGTVKTQLHRALQELRTRVHTAEGEEVQAWTN